SPFLLLGVSCARSSVLEYFSKLLNHPIAPSNYNSFRFLVFPSFAQRAFAAPPPSPLPGKSPLLLASGAAVSAFTAVPPHRSRRLRPAVATARVRSPGVLTVRTPSSAAPLQR
ncbi:hypothetical protein IscW_ISCW019947, partial [Ixodes scapularis]